MKWFEGKWPLMWKSTHEEVRRENWNLRDALRLANEELRKHRILLGSLRAADSSAAEQLEKLLMKKD